EVDVPPGGLLGVGAVVRVDLRVLLPLLGQLILREARIDRARLDAGVAVNALLGVDVQHLDRVIPGLVGCGVDAVHRADLDTRVVLGADARLCDHIRHWLVPVFGGNVSGEAILYEACSCLPARPARWARLCCCACSPKVARFAAWCAIHAGSERSVCACRSRSATSPIRRRSATRCAACRRSCTWPPRSATSRAARSRSSTASPPGAWSRPPSARGSSASRS